MEPYRVSLIGHRRVDSLREVEEALTAAIEELIRTKSYVEFQLGRNGDFDMIAASCIRQVQKRLGNHNSAMTLVLPYPVAAMDDYEAYYDSILIPDEVYGSHPKSAITKRNRWLVQNADLLIAYVHRETGGAATCLGMAEEAGVSLLRI